MAWIVQEITSYGRCQPFGGLLRWAFVGGMTGQGPLLWGLWPSRVSWRPKDARLRPIIGFRHLHGDFHVRGPGHHLTSHTPGPFSFPVCPGPITRRLPKGWSSFSFLV